MRGAWFALGVALFALGLNGCATIIHGRAQDISISSSPSEARVTLSDSSGRTCITQRTPCTVSLKRGDGFFRSGSYTVPIEKEGYRPWRTQIEGRANGWYIAGNFVFGGLIGWVIVDPATGAMWTLIPEVTNADLTKQ